MLAWVENFNFPLSHQQQDQVPGVHIVPSSLFGIGAYGLPGQVAALHPFVMQQQGAPPSVTSANTHIPQSHVGQLQSGPAISFHPQWENQQVKDEVIVQLVVLYNVACDLLNHFVSI